MRVSKAGISALMVLLGMPPDTASAQSIMNNYPDRVAHVLNLSPDIELSNFQFENAYVSRSSQFRQILHWTNRGAQPIVAFEVVVLKFDPFDRPLIGSRWIVSGHNSANWRPLPPGASDDDGTLEPGSEEVFTAIAYVRRVRRADGTVWTIEDTELREQLRMLAPNLRDVGDLAPSADGRENDQPLTP